MLSLAPYIKLLPVILKIMLIPLQDQIFILWLISKLIIKNKATHQIIDSYGKMRGLIFPSNNISGNNITILFPASQPENLPISNEMIRANVDIVVEEFGEPIAITKSGNTVTGLWYTILDITYGLYCPVLPTDEFTDKPIGLDTCISRRN